MKDIFFLNPISQQYEYNGKIIPRVTDILPPQNFYCTSKQLEAARLEGEANHLKIKNYLDTGKGKRDCYVKTFQKFLNENPLLGKILLYEKPLLSKKYLFAGTPDILFENANLDLKRSMNNLKYHSLQLAAYNILRKENISASVKKWYILIINSEDETYRVKNVYNALAENIFLSILKKINIDAAIENYLKG